MRLHSRLFYLDQRALMYIDLVKLKQKLGIQPTDTSRDAELELLLDESWALIISMSYARTRGTYKQKFSYSEICGEYMQFLIPGLVSIDKRAGEVYTGEYEILDNSVAYLCGCGCMKCGDCKYFEVEFTAGFAPIPEDLCLAQYYIIKSLMEGGMNALGATDPSCNQIKSVTIGPKTVSFKDNGTITKAQLAIKYNDMAMKIFDKYRIYQLGSVC